MVASRNPSPQERPYEYPAPTSRDWRVPCLLFWIERLLLDTPGTCVPLYGGGQGEQTPEDYHWEGL